jgi:signal transduction histidine kinase
VSWLERSLFRKMLVCCALPALCGLAILGCIAVQTFGAAGRAAAEQELIRLGKTVNAVLNQSGGRDVGELLASFEQTLQKRITAFDLTGQIVAASYADEVYKDITLSEEDRIALRGGEVVRSGIVKNDENRMMLTVIVPWGSEENVRGGLQLQMPAESLFNLSRQIREQFVWSAILMFILSTFSSSILYWSVIRPLKQIETTATEIAIGHYDKRLPVHQSDELGQMALALNRLAEKLGRTEEERIHLEQRRDDLLSNISHELRTPLTAIQGFVEAIQDGLVQDEATLRRYLSVIEKESKHMNRLVDDLMDLIKLKDRKIQLFRDFLRIDELLRKVCLRLQPQADARGNELLIECPPDLPPLFADSVRLEQIFTNLIHNAIKYTENGTIRITAEHAGAVIRISVSDTGIGIPSYELDRIWERFYKAQYVRREQNAGAGLGLAIVKELVELHEGSITVESQLGRGSTFTVHFPVHETQSSFV